MSDTYYNSKHKVEGSRTVGGVTYFGIEDILDGAVLGNNVQSLSSAEKARARDNIGAYQKPSGGIPKSDLNSDVQATLDNCDSAYQKPIGGIPKTDLSQAVQTSLGKADTALQASQKGAENGVASLDSSGKVPIGQFPVDSALSTTSENPVQNKVIAAKIDDLKSASLKVIGQIASTVTALSTLTEPGTYFIPKSYVSNLTDKPSGTSTSNNYALIVWYSNGQKVQQILVDWGGTDMWKRHKTTTSFVEWAKLTNNAETQAIIYTASQSLTTAQKTQALTNIGALMPDEIFTMRGDVASGTTVLSTFTTPGVYQIPRNNIGSLTDLPDNYETNRNTMLMVCRTDDTTVWQLLVEKEPGYLWARSINTSTPTVGTWSEIGNTRYLAQANSTGDANSLSWTGFYGWGSTETITNVPTGMNVGMLLNVVRSANVKYQMAFDYFSNNVYTRHNQSGTWSSWERLAMMSDVTRKTVMFYYETRSSSQVPAKLHVYIPASTGYIHYELTHFIIDSKNCDVWRVSFVYRCDDNFENDSELTIAGEWECAIHNHPEDTDLDFSGGSTHGDEVLTDDPVFLIDGVPVTISGYSTMTACKELRIIRTSTMYDSADSTTEIADHGVEYVFTEDGLTINQSLKWRVATNLYRCFLCMYTPSKVNIDRAVGNADFAVMELPTDTTVKNYAITKAGSTAVTMWDTATGWFSEVSVPVYPTGLVGGDEMWVKDNNNDYNKVYFVVSAGGSVSIGDLWKSTSVYKIDYKAPEA